MRRHSANTPAGVSCCGPREIRWVASRRGTALADSASSGVAAAPVIPRLARSAAIAAPSRRMRSTMSTAALALLPSHLRSRRAYTNCFRSASFGRSAENCIGFEHRVRQIHDRSGESRVDLGAVDTLVACLGQLRICSQRHISNRCSANSSINLKAWTGLWVARGPHLFCACRLPPPCDSQCLRVSHPMAVGAANRARHLSDPDHPLDESNRLRLIVTKKSRSCACSDPRRSTFPTNQANQRRAPTATPRSSCLV